MMRQCVTCIGGDDRELKGPYVEDARYDNFVHCIEYQADTNDV